MKRISGYFENAKTTPFDERKMGIETESLLIYKRSDQPISFQTSQGIFSCLICDFGWEMRETKNGKVVKIEKGGFELFYELGWNNFELVTPVFHVCDDEIYSKNELLLAEINSAAQKFGAYVSNMSWDKDESNTLIIPDKRDEIWLDLDGNVLFGLGHIACIHFNIDLVSIDEGMDFISRLLPLYCDYAWPAEANKRIWQNYLRGSKAQYQDGRYGPPPTSFAEYCNKIASYRIVMNVIDGELKIADPQVEFSQCENLNLDMFLRSVWWWMRLRVRNGKLVLELREVSRTLPIKESFNIIRTELNI